MNTAEARALGMKIAATLVRDDIETAYGLLAPVLAQRTHFRYLDVIGARLADAPLKITDAFLDRIATERTMGGWVVIASALNQLRMNDLEHALDRCRSFIVLSDTWYAADSLAERVPGQALVADFDRTLKLLDPWRYYANRWMRRATGVSVHFWGKRTRGNAEHSSQAQALLSFLEPLFSEQEMDAVKGIGWGLKTLGRYYPQQVSAWLEDQVFHEGRPYQTVMLRKALTYLPPETGARLRRA